MWLRILFAPRRHVHLFHHHQDVLLSLRRRNLSIHETKRSWTDTSRAINRHTRRRLLGVRPCEGPRCNLNPMEYLIKFLGGCGSLEGLYYFYFYLVSID